MLISLCLMSLGLPLLQPGMPSIEGKTVYKPHELVRLSAKGTEPTDALVWRVTPRLSIDKATTAPHLLQFSAKPGKYTIDLLIIRKVGEAFRVIEASTSVEVKGAPEPPKEKPGEDDGEKPRAALGKIQFGSSFCTATIIGPRREDGRWLVLTAAHCISRIGQRGTFTSSDKRRFAVTVRVLARDPDCAWCVTDDPIDEIPYAFLAKSNPRAGERVWHAGFGVHKPGNLERGEVHGPESRKGQMSFKLSVSSGDSGGGIFLESTGEVVSTVCCTTRLSGFGLMFGCSPRVAEKLRPTEVAVDFGPRPKPLPLLPHDWEDVGLKAFPIPVVPEEE